MITLPHQRVQLSTPKKDNDHDHQQKDHKDNQSKITWSEIVDILSNMSYDEESLKVVFQKLASHSGSALIKTLNDERYSKLKCTFYQNILPFIVKLILNGLPLLFPFEEKYIHCHQNQIQK